MSDSGGSTIITVRKQPRYTNVDYREMLSLCAQDLAELRVLSKNVTLEEEFNDIIITILAIMVFLGRDFKKEVDRSYLSFDISFDEYSSAVMNDESMHVSDSDSCSTINSCSSSTSTSMSSISSCSSNSSNSEQSNVSTYLSLIIIVYLSLHAYI